MIKKSPLEITRDIIRESLKGVAEYLEFNNNNKNNNRCISSDKQQILQKQTKLSRV